MASEAQAAGEVEIQLTINGKPRQLVLQPPSMSALIDALEMKPDRIAVELNGKIARRGTWNEIVVNDGDRLEIVHFVGGGSAFHPCARKLQNMCYRT